MRLRTAVLAFVLLSPLAALKAAPDWARDAVWYQIFAERFRNGDASNDPTPSSLEDPDNAPAGWRISPWTREWYARDEWEQNLGKDFFSHGVFNRRYGGDLQGVIDKLDYLRDLGVNALYFNPVFYARSMHKYDGLSMHHIDPYFGPDPAGDLALIETETADPSTWKWTSADKLFLRLLSEARARGIRVIIDGVFNHTGRDFFAFRNLREKQAASPYKDWYVVYSFDDPATSRYEFDYEGWWGFKSLPTFAHSADNANLHPGAKKYVFDITRRWMDPNGDGDPSDGVDGWRLDVSEEVPHGFWKEWNALVHSINPVAYTSSEIWGPSAHYLTETDFNAAMNYDGFAMPVKRFIVDDGIDAATFAAQLDKSRESHAPANAHILQNLMDSHDTDRLASMIVNGVQRARFGLPRLNYDQGNSPRWNSEYLIRSPDVTERRVQRLLTVFQVSYVGAPMIYYGTEAGMWGADDPCDRMPMSWADLAMEPQTRGPAGPDGRNDPTAFDVDLHAFYRSAFKVRHEQAALRRGSYRTLHAPEKAQTFAFIRELDGDVVITALNPGSEAASLTLNLTNAEQSAPKTLAKLLCASEDTRFTYEGGVLKLELPAKSGVLLGSKKE